VISSRSHLGLGPTVGAGLAAATICLVASTKPWLEIGNASGEVSSAVLNGVTEAPPLASSLSLVLVASWGALLVTRGRFRRMVAMLAVVAAVGLAVVVIRFATGGADDARGTLADLGAGQADISVSAWCWAALAAAIGSTLVSSLAVKIAPSWPEMSRRYDAPERNVSDDGVTDMTSTIDVWKALDKGKDPTA
jgi:uncharacterized membrane protein (TIGR02234 family)